MLSSPIFMWAVGHRPSVSLSDLGLRDIPEGWTIRYSRDILIQDSRSKIPRFKIQDPEIKIPKSRSRNQDPEIKIPKSRSRNQDPEIKIPKSRSRNQDPEIKIPKSRSRNQDPEIKIMTDNLNKLYQVSKGKECFHRPSPYFTGIVRL